MSPPLSRRLAAVDWASVEAQLDARGYAHLERVLTPAECSALIELYADDRRFRSRIDMEHHAFGRGHYAYFAEPLPRTVASLRSMLYRRLAPMADRMLERLGSATRYPRTLPEYRRACALAGQVRPTPLLLRYEAGGYNRLHRDLYGPLHFPLQVAVGLSRRGADFEGGQFLLVENRPRQQASGTAVELDRGEMIVFPVYERPVEGRRGTYRAQMRHGVSPVLRGVRWTLGVIFHDAQ